MPNDDEYHQNLTAPERTEDQRLQALKRANEVRLERAQLKRKIKEGHQSILGLIERPPKNLLTFGVYDLLMAVHKYGRVKVYKILGECRISPVKTLGGLSERQRSELIALLRSKPEIMALEQHRLVA